MIEDEQCPRRIECSVEAVWLVQDVGYATWIESVESTVCAVAPDSSPGQ